MARSVIAGIYKITNKKNGKVYIGQSKDILRRFRLYHWGSTTYSDYRESQRLITQAIREDGFENFDFSIIESGPRYEDPINRAIDEMKYIAIYKANDPKFGYNQTTGGELSSTNPRKQEFYERIRRAKPAFLYNMENKSVQLYMFGAKAIADDFNCDKAITSHALNRMDVFAGKYFIIPARFEDRYTLYMKRIKAFDEIINKPDALDRIVKRTENRKKRLIKIVEYIDEIAPQFGYSVDD